VPPARAAVTCFAPHRSNPEAYGVAARKVSRSCERQATTLLAAVTEAPAQERAEAAEERFAAEQAVAAVVAGAAYYRAAFSGSYSWNVRERSMEGTVRAVAAHIGAVDDGGRVIVWTHNSHVGNAASSAMVDRGEVSLADLLRAGHPGEVFTVGFLTHSGGFMAAPAWGRPGQVYRLPPASRGSVEGLLHRAGLGRSVLMLRDGNVRGALSEWRPERAIGVVFDPGAPPELSYSRARLGTQFDAVAFLDRTENLTPLP